MSKINRLFCTVTPMRGRGFRGGGGGGGGGGGSGQRGDMFRSRPPNTSRPPSLHVDDFVALETCGQQPTGPTGYNKISMRAAQVCAKKNSFILDTINVSFGANLFNQSSDGLSSI